jgi:hypothetical protein
MPAGTVTLVVTAMPAGTVTLVVTAMPAGTVTLVVTAIPAVTAIPGAVTAIPEEMGTERRISNDAKAQHLC